MTAPVISVLLPVYRGAAHLEESLESVLGQRGVEFELVALDDGSDDESPRILQRSERHPRVRLMRRADNRGLFTTLNELISASRSPILHLWAQDDRMLPGCLARTLEFWEAHPGLGMAHSQYDVIDEQSMVVERAKVDTTPTVIPPWLSAQLSYYWGCLPGNIANVSLRRAVVDQVGGFDPTYRVAGDWDLWTRITEHHDAGFIAQTLLEVRRHAGQLSRAGASVLPFVREGALIRRRLEARLPSSLLAEARRFDRRHRRVKQLHQVLRAVQRLDLRLAADLLRELRQEGDLGRVALRWLISGNARWLRQSPRYVPPATN